MFASSRRPSAARSRTFAPLAALIALGATSVACGSAPGDGSALAESTGASSAADVGPAGGTLVCNAAVTTCTVRNMPHFLQDDPMISKYWWHIYPDEAATGLTSAQKGSNVRAYGCYDASIAMLTSAALANRDPSLVAPLGTRTHEFLGLTQTATFTRLQNQQLYTPISNYDGGGPSHNYATRGNAFSFPEIVANLSTWTTDASCDPLTYGSCGHYDGSAGTADVLWLAPSNAATVTNGFLTSSLWNEWNALIGFYWGSYSDFSEFHKVAVAGFDFTNAKYPILINDPGAADASTMVHARIGVKATGDGLANPFPDASAASWPYFEYEGGNSDALHQYNYVQFVERVRLTSQWRKAVPTAPQCTLQATCSGALSFNCAMAAGETLSYAVAAADGTYPAPTSAAACTVNAGTFAHPLGKMNVKLCASNYSWTDPTCVIKTVTLPSCFILQTPLSCRAGTTPPNCSVANPQPGCLPPPSTNPAL